MILSWQPPTDTVLIEVVDRVGVIRFNRPDRRNALRDDMYAPMTEAIEAFAAAPDVGCVVLTGVGGWARLGFSGDFGGAWLLAHRIGHAAALEFLALNRTVTASDALVLGLVDRVVDDESLETTWRTLAAEFAAGPKAAIGLMKANLNDAIRLSLGDALRVEAERMVASSRTQDHREAVRAWVERRDPRFGPATEHD